MFRVYDKLISIKKKGIGILVVESKTLSAILNEIVENLKAKLNLEISDQFKITAE